MTDPKNAETDVTKTGVSVIDLEHQQLSILIGLLEDALPLVPSHMADMLLDRFQREAVHHLEREPRMMLACDAPGYDSHVADHRRFLDLLSELAAAVQTRKVEAARNTLAQAKAFFLERLLPADLEFAEHYRRTVGAIPEPG